LEIDSKNVLFHTTMRRRVGVTVKKKKKKGVEG